jgi:hypothetical protein
MKLATILAALALAGCAESYPGYGPATDYSRFMPPPDTFYVVPVAPAPAAPVYLPRPYNIYAPYRGR